jgi:hypothetical protein
MPERNPDVQGNSDAAAPPTAPVRSRRANPSAVELGSARTMRWLGAALFAPALGIGLSACAESRVSLATGPRDYPHVLKLWTREENLIIFTELEHTLAVTATFESWDFRWAYVVRYAADYRLTVEQRRALLDRTLREALDTHEFYVALYGTKWRWVDLSRPESAWIVRLIDDQGDETAPERIELITKPGPLEERYFPYTTVWRRAFRIRFPGTTSDGRPTIARAAKWFGLRFAGAEGNEELVWRLEPRPDGTKDDHATPAPGG